MNWKKKEKSQRKISSKNLTWKNKTKIFSKKFSFCTYLVFSTNVPSYDVDCWSLGVRVFWTISVGRGKCEDGRTAALLMVASTLVCDACSFWYLIRRPWYHTFIWRSVSCSSAAREMRFIRHKYLLMANSSSNLDNCLDVKAE